MSTVAALLLLAGCASKPMLSYSERTPPTVMTTLDGAGVRDLRGEFRAALCPKLATAGSSCDRVLLRFPGETQAVSLTPSVDLAKRYRIVFVPGLFAECLEGMVRPFEDVMGDLRDRGFDVQYLRVSGRGTVAQNAERLAKDFARLAEDPRPIIVFAYSKGLPDVLDMAVRHPEAAGRIAAIVAVAGAVNGTPLAEDWKAFYASVGARWPMSRCAAGTGAEIDDLRREPRLAWWRRYGAGIGIPLFSLVAVPRPEHVSPMLAAMHARLAESDPRNDGQLLWYDAIAPRGSLLGYVNADHWTIAIDFNHQVPLMAGLFRDDVPRSALVEAAIEVVDRTRTSGGDITDKPLNSGKAVSVRP